MLKNFLTLIVAIALSSSLMAQEWLVLTTVESVVPMGVGRSRMIMQTDSVNYEDFTTVRTDGKQAKDRASRGDVKIDNMEETLLLNFYSIAGINFQNIASNDAVITSKLNDLSKKGYKLMFVTSAVESDAGKNDGNGIFITRFIFFKE